MLNEEQAQPVTPTLWQSTKKFLFEPHSTITEAGARQEARLISIINLLFAFLSLAGAISIFGTNGASGNVFVLLGLALVASTAYILARTRFYKIGSYVIVWALVIAAFGGGDASRLTNSLHTNLILAFLIASITFPFRYMVFFVILNNAIIGLIPLVYPDFTDAGVTLGLFIPFSLLVLAVMRHRENIERDRFANIKQFNQELTILRRELEQRVEDRTVMLEKRARQLQVVTEVARTAASFQDLDRLLTNSTRLISESFDFYHVGIFLVDEEGQYAILRATNSEGGQRMLARMHTLPVDLNSIVGYTAQTQSPRIALDTGTATIYFKNPDLPETRSEMAVPLKVGMRLIGILDVQSVEKDAFSDDDIAILSALGDQLAVAIDNTRLLTETRRALVTAEQTYQRYFSQAWSQFARRLDVEGYRYHDGRLIPLSEKAGGNQVEEINQSKLSIPLIVRGQNIGFLDIQPTNEKRGWNPDEIAVLEAAAERAALALESARLLENAQRRAAREHTISNMANKISSVTNIDSILRSTVEELGQQIGGTEVTFELSTASQDSQEQ
jgi:GAF domain-containing protein